MQAYSDPRRESDPHALPDVEVFYMTSDDFMNADQDSWMYKRIKESIEDFENCPESEYEKLEGWYWWPCFPGCLPDGDPVGPFETEAEALADAREVKGRKGMKYTKTEIAESMATLREWLKPGDTVYTVVRHVSRSGMMRVIDALILDNGTPRHLNYHIARVLDWSESKDRDGIKVDGCGMDMGFHLVYSLSSVLFRDGFGCVGKAESGDSWCPSNDHSNGDRDYTPHEKAEPRICTECNDGKVRVHHLYTRDDEAPDMQNCRTCHGTAHLGPGHWHRDGGYALRQRWL